MNFEWWQIGIAVLVVGALILVLAPWSFVAVSAIVFAVLFGASAYVSAEHNPEEAAGRAIQTVFTTQLGWMLIFGLSAGLSWWFMPRGPLGFMEAASNGFQSNELADPDRQANWAWPIALFLFMTFPGVPLIFWVMGGSSKSSGDHGNGHGH